MDSINASVPQKSHFSPQTPLFISNYSHPNRFRTNPSKNYRFLQTFPLKIPPLSFSPPSSRPNLSVSAHFGGPSKRRNSLRKKLIEEQKNGVLHSDKGLIFESPVYNSDEIEVSEKIQNLGNLDEGSTSGVEKSKFWSDSASWNKFESWVDQYKKDVEFWGIGSGPVFTVVQDIEGKVERVSVNEDEILRRSRIEPSFFKQEGRNGMFVEANSKIAHARRMAREVENGVYEFPRNSSVAKFVVLGQETETGFVSRIRSVVLRPEMLSKLPKIGFMMVCSLFVLWSVRKLFVGSNNEAELTREEKEMLRRKMKARMESGRVEVLPKVVEPLRGSSVRPQLDKEELMSSIAKLKAPGEELRLPDSSSSLDAETRKFNDKISEIKTMARQARELERETREEPKDVNKEISNETIDKELHVHVDSANPMHISSTEKLSYGDDSLTLTAINASDNNGSQVSDTVEDEGNGKSWLDPDTRETLDTQVLTQSCDSPNTEPTHADDLSRASVLSLENTDSQITISPTTDEGSESVVKSKCDQNDKESDIAQSMETKQVQPSIVPDEKTDDSDKSSNSIKPKIILTVKEAKEYLSQKHNKGELDKEPKIKGVGLGPDILESSTDEEVQVKGNQVTRDARELYESSVAEKISETKSDLNDCQNSAQTKTNSDGDIVPSIPFKTNDFNSTEKNYEMDDFEEMGSTTEKYGDGDYNKEATPVISKDSWVERNFHELEPIIKKIGEGYTKNYAVAKEKAHEELNLRSEIPLPGYGDSELEWMNDDGLREIVFRVRENELLGHDPFHMMDAEDKLTFFKGLEKKAEKESEQLLKLHEYLHSRIENLDYGADGISVHDSPKKIIPRWKGPTVDKDPEFLNKPVNRSKDIFDENTGVSPLVNENSRDTLKKSSDTTASDDLPSTGNYISREAPQGRAPKSPKTVIESSDGSVRAGKKSGKEYWQHTKKWSREFLELYNAETDPEVKSIMKDMGKDLDRWITEKEVQETAELMDNIPLKKRQYIEKKIGKLKREMEMFGPQAVVSKYREYGEAEEEDYLWWLDLPYVLCIELYTTEDGAEKVGFYSLEMAEDLELDPKQYHVIAFEDPGDSKSFCYIMQAHLEMLGTGSAFVVARPPKDAFREAKANGFSVTVIRKGELLLNVDQTLEEVEEQIAEIGSKVYHNKMIRERGVDMGALMKGVFGSNKPTKRRRSKRKTKKLPGTEK